MNLKDTDLENKRKQAVDALVADSTTLAERLLKTNDFEITCHHLREHARLAQAVINVLPQIETPTTKPDRLHDALRAAVLGSLAEILSKAAKE